MEIWFDDDLKDVRFQGFFEVARSVGWLARLWITLVLLA
jgi:citrate synthase